MRQLPILPALLLLATATPALAGDEVTVRRESAAFPAQGLRLLTVEVPVGHLEVSAGDFDRVEARLQLRCDERASRCKQQAAAVRLRPTRDHNTLALEVTGYPRSHRHKSPEAHLQLSVPRALALRLELGVGEVEIEDLEADLDLELGVGEATVRVPEAAVREVAIDVGVGEANLTPRPSGTRSSRFLFLGNEIDWEEGSGRARISVEVGVGEADVRLMP